MVVATKLLARKQLIDTGKQFNMIAASWIQFMIHDWIDHLEENKPEVASECPLKSFRFFETKEIDTGLSDIKKGHRKHQNSLVDGVPLLQHDNDGLPIAGDIRNSWIGVSTLQALFIHEHNAVCDTLKKEYPYLDDEDLYRHARLVTSAVIAKVHTIDWTIELLKTDMLVWAIGEKDSRTHLGMLEGLFLGGLVGLKKPENHGVPYSLTEEFTSVYRMHSLLPDQLVIRDLNSTPGPNKSPKITKEYVNHT
ncbi:putative heme peroxidase superfamily, heme peroxidase, animal-type [Helianthus annuus]|nr:putative heme peroxidase superfamily, heme peroxidase, animal-type [Helianthus annuus]